MRPQSFVDAANSVLKKSALSRSFITILRDEERGAVDDEMRRRMSLVVAPHVRRAVLIGKVVSLKQAEAATFADLLDGRSAAMFLISADGQMAHANTAGHGMLNSGNILSAINGRLFTGDKKTDKRLNETFAAANYGDAGIGIKGLSLSLNARGGERYVAHILASHIGRQAFGWNRICGLRCHVRS